MKLYILKNAFPFILLGFLLNTALYGQITKMGFNGFVKSDIYWDSRQVASARQGHFLLYPLNSDFDKDGRDINAANSFHILPIQSRLGFFIEEKNVFSAVVYAKIEGAFFGSTEEGINNFRLRHAFIRLNWSNTRLLVGQYWHPLFIETNYPGTISFNTGAPFIPFSRNPQIRLTFKKYDLAASFTIFSQLDFKSSGPIGSSTTYITHSKLPSANFRVIYNPIFASGTRLITGFSLNSKQLRPTLISESGYIDETLVNTYAGSVFMGIKGSKAGVKLQLTYGEDMYNLTMLGGYGVSKITNELTMTEEYTPNRTMAFWIEVYNVNPIHQVGLLLGYTQNEGSIEPCIRQLYGRGYNMDNTYRISPRYAYKQGHFKLATELEYTVAAYGTPDEYGKVIDVDSVGNLRALFAVYYFFNIDFK